MYIAVSLTGLCILIAVLMLLAYSIVNFFTKVTKHKDKKQTKEERIWERLKENQEATSKNSSQ